MEESVKGLEDQVVLITGAASGIGAGTARRLAAEGCLVALVDRDEDAVRSLAGELPAALAIPADVAVEADVIDAFDETTRHFGRLDGVHLNAGIAGPFGAIADLDADDFDRVIAVNQRSVFLDCAPRCVTFVRPTTGVPWWSRRPWQESVRAQPSSPTPQASSPRSE